MMHRQDENDIGAAILVVMALVETHPDKRALGLALRRIVANLQAGLAAHGLRLDRDGLQEALQDYLNKIDGPPAAAPPA